MHQDDSELQASVDQEVSWFLSRLFAGIELDSPTHARAQQVITKYVEQMRVPRPPAPGIWDRWDEAMATYATRDRELGALLGGEARDAFLRNSARLQAHFDELRANATDRPSDSSDRAG